MERDKVKLILIGESHVYTTLDDLQISIIKSRLPLVAANVHTPSEFVRLIYCLGYGEPEILSNPAIQRNIGTIQFWDIFGRVAGTGLQPRKRDSTSSTDDRLKWKVRTLTQLQDKGIWLLDASLHGIYAPGGERVSQNLLTNLHKVWWNYYGRPLLAEMPATKIWAIGKSVGEQLTALGCRVDGWIYQPNARIPNPKRESMWPDLLKNC